ncbi:MAG TPA: hypothetical protein VFM34_03230 [Moraxellaceae bacterium]|nr:hypothetical protein [Moraxellaceae bacterium]
MTKPKKGPGGRPSTFSFDVVDRICEQLADGMSLRAICRADDMPSKATVFKWLREQPGFSDQYARAMEARADSHVDDITEIADRTDLDANDKRVRIDARKWVASKLKPKRYGDKALIGSDPDNPLPATSTVDVVALAKALRDKKSTPGT